MIGSFGVGGLMIGATIGGKWIASGRVRVLDMAAYIGILGAGLGLI